eukprot:661622-Prymnesium_polylepis.3
MANLAVLRESLDLHEGMGCGMCMWHVRSESSRMVCLVSWVHSLNSRKRTTAQRFTLDRKAWGARPPAAIRIT